MFQFLKKLTAPFAKMKSLLGQKIKALFSRGADDHAFDELEKLLYEADLGASAAADLVEEVRRFVKKTGEASSDPILAFVKERLLAKLGPPPAPATLHTPHVILIVGVNGSGKTTSVAKLAAHYRSEGKRVLIGACDTFRAAAVDQLATWAERIGADLVKAQPNSDPAAVAYDALQASVSRGADLVLIDTAGRLQTKTDLMHELAKLKRVCQKALPGSPHETLLVLDATIGQNALDQAKTFHQFTPITGAILTKLDGSAKGGIAVAIQSELSIPIRWVGTGELSEDLAVFDPVSYVDSLLSEK